jgi:formylglycine-generating enzyme required for sulfatase activity
MIKMTLVACLALLACSLSAVAQPAPGRRVALVIGTGSYQTVPQLANPVRDGRAIAQALRGLAFEVDELYDPDARSLIRGIRDFGIKAQHSDVALVYYAGHGVQVAHENYLIPVDARLERERDLLYEAVSLDLMLGEVSQTAKLGIVLLDACRNNPFVDRISRSLPAGSRGMTTSGLARVDNVPRNTVVAMSTRADEVAEDGAGDHSPFAAALLANFATPGLELSLFFRTVRDAVLRATAGRQEPYVFSSVGADPFYFRPLPPKRPPVVEAARRVRMYTGPIGITHPEDEAGDPLTVIIKTVPRGLVRDDTRQIRAGDRIGPDVLARLVFVPEPGFTGSAGLLSYQVEGPGGVSESAVEIEVMDAAEAAAQLAEASLWERVRNTERVEDLELFSRLYPNSRFGPAASQRRVELARAAQPSPAPVGSVAPAPPPPAAASLPPAPAPGAPPAQDFALAQPGHPIRGMAPPAPDGPGFRDCPTCPTMMNIPGGTFVMGLGSKDPAARPAHKVSVRPFALQQSPVTVGDWKACEADHGCGPAPPMSAADDATPLYNASWDDAQQYIAWLSRTSGQAYRLPSEAEWEYAARAGTTTRFSWGEQAGVGLANCSDCGGAQDPHVPVPAQRFRPNPFGLYGMAGGVSQWVGDCWVPNYTGAPADGSARETRGCQQRVLRGGSFRSPHDDITPTSRNRYDAPVRYLTNGFRVARNVEGVR